MQHFAPAVMSSEGIVAELLTRSGGATSLGLLAQKPVAPEPKRCDNVPVMAILMPRSLVTSS